MSMRKVKNTHHAYIRAKQRCGLPKRKAQQLIKEAYTAGIPVGALNPGPLKDYLINKQTYRNKRVKIYKGYVFIFSSTSTRCITVYEVDAEIMEKQRQYEEAQKIR